LIALNAKTINSFDEKNERDANERVDERTKERESVYELREETNMMMKKRTYEMMMIMKKKRDQTNKKEKLKKKSKNK
jgi:flagellar basal body rod protein FlgF